MEFSKQDDRNGLPFPSPGDLPNPGIEPLSSALPTNSLPTVPSGRSIFILNLSFVCESGYFWGQV